MKKIEFTKMHGCGNNYIYVDTMRFPISAPERLAREWSDVNTGIGGDGLVLIGRNEEGDFTMRIFNSDGSEAQMCGNASRCIGKYLYEHGLTQQTTVRLSTLSGLKVLKLHLDKSGHRVESVTVDMGVANYADARLCHTTDGRCIDGKVTAINGSEYVGTFVSMGNPHFVVFVDDVEHLDVAGVGPTLEKSEMFPERCNIEFATVRPDGTIRMRVWERGSGITMACGTGACATFMAALATGRGGEENTIVMDGGELHIALSSDGHVMMTGPAVCVYEGVITSYDDDNDNKNEIR